jgi:hypothetical protein
VGELLQEAARHRKVIVGELLQAAARHSNPSIS